MPREFLNDEFPDLGTLTAAIFRKGYQWPFDPRRVRDHGSSLIDLLVHRERIERGRRVFLDFTRNPDGGARLGQFSLGILHDEPRQYLEKCGATGGTPLERLAQMNQPALDFYLANGIDLGRDRLEIAVCAQHNNGGLNGNIWWESNVAGLFPVGEVNGTHGVRRPGGASLNAGQVGALRAATFIAHRRRDGAPTAERVCGDGRTAGSRGHGSRLRDAARCRRASGAAPMTCATRSNGGCRVRARTSAGSRRRATRRTTHAS